MGVIETPSVSAREERERERERGSSRFRRKLQRRRRRHSRSRISLSLSRKHTETDRPSSFPCRLVVAVRAYKLCKLTLRVRIMARIARQSASIAVDLLGNIFPLVRQSSPPEESRSPIRISRNGLIVGRMQIIASRSWPSVIIMGTPNELVMNGRMENPRRWRIIIWHTFDKVTGTTGNPCHTGRSAGGSSGGEVRCSSFSLPFSKKDRSEKFSFKRDNFSRKGRT